MEKILQTRKDPSMALNLTVGTSLSNEIQNVTDQNGSSSGLYLGLAPTQSILTGTICAAATTVSGLDSVGSYMPMVLAGNTTDFTFGEEIGDTMGRLLRLIDLRTGTFYDIGIDQNNSLFVNAGNQLVLTLDSSGNLTIPGTLTT